MDDTTKKGDTTKRGGTKTGLVSFKVFRSMANEERKTGSGDERKTGGDERKMGGDERK